jgi:uncharacterized protein YdeI (YjbR/CyaY-like superfamily)
MTDQCKVKTWHRELALLRDIMLQSGLEETAKWGQPCYTLKGKNVAMIFSFKDACGISFFKGALLKDEQKILVSAGENSHIIKLLKVHTPEQVIGWEPYIHAYVAEAIELEKAGAKVEKPTEREPLPDTLLNWLEQDSALRGAWEALTPGRQRSYILHVGGSKNESTQLNRIEKCIPKIFAGKGFNER